MNKNIKYKIWDGEDINATYYSHIIFPNGGQTLATLNNITIKKGDSLSLDYGRSMQVYTRSGKGFEPEFPFGKASLNGVGAFIILNETTVKNLKLEENTKEFFNELSIKQKERTQQEIKDGNDLFIFNRLESINKNKISKELADQKHKKMISEAVSKIDNFFQTKPKNKF